MFDPLANNIVGASAKPVRRLLQLSEIKERLDMVGRQLGIEATHEHAEVMHAILGTTDCVFLTGSAGSGKTTFVKHMLIPELNYRGVNFAVTATTGIAGSHVQGRTLHSWAGVGLGPQWPEGLPVTEMPQDVIQAQYEYTYTQWTTNKRISIPMREGTRSRIKACEVLILEEVSMCPGLAFLDYIDFFFRKVRGIAEPFGGIQMLFIGDFCQLPPVDKANGALADWAFNSKSWHAAKVRPMQLTKIYRQKDIRFVDILNKIRAGNLLSHSDLNYLAPFIRKPTETEAPKLTHLVPTNAEADRINEMVLPHFEGETWIADAEFDIREDHLKHYENRQMVMDQLSRGTIMKTRLKLKIGLPMLITVNDPSGSYVNGTKCYVEEVVTVDGRITEVRVKLHPKEGEVNPPSYSFERTIKTRSVAEDPEDKLITEEADPATGERKQVQLSKWPSMQQFPIIPASAITVHKSQGMSLVECVISLDKAFAAGHVYVALSRLTSVSGLILTSDNLPIFADPEAMRFHGSIPVIAPPAPQG